MMPDGKSQGCTEVGLDDKIEDLTHDLTLDWTQDMPDMRMYDDV